MKGIILLKDHFEDVEALITIDLLRRAKIQIDMISMNDSIYVTTQSNITMKCDELLSNININDYDFVVLPGGKAVYEYHINSDVTKNILKSFYNSNKLVACICAAPMVLGLIGVLENINYTCYPSCESISFKGNYTKENVEQVDNVITSKACGTTFDFGLKIIEYLVGKEQALQIKNSVYYH